MIYSTEVNNMCSVCKGAYHGPAPIPEEGKWIQAKEIKDISGYTHGIGWCAPQQGACKLSLNVTFQITDSIIICIVKRSRIDFIKNQIFKTSFAHILTN